MATINLLTKLQQFYKGKYSTYTNIEKIKLNNFRAVSDILKPDLFIITEQCYEFKILNMSMKQFLEVISKNLTIEKFGMFLGCSLICQKCNGTGITDWVTNIMGRTIETNLYLESINFKAKKGNLIPIVCNVHAGDRGTLYFNQAKISKATEHCRFCNGSGVFKIYRELKKEEPK